MRHYTKVFLILVGDSHHQSKGQFAGLLLRLLMLHVQQDKVLAVEDLDFMSKITISGSKKVVEGSLAGVYVCEVYLPDIAENNPIYANSPDEADKNANIFVEAYLKEKVKNVERLLRREDIRKSLVEELDWTKKELAEKQWKTNISVLYSGSQLVIMSN